MFRRRYARVVNDIRSRREPVSRKAKRSGRDLMKKIRTKICRIKNFAYLRSAQAILRELSSVGSERLPYKQRVGGSTPSAPTSFKFLENTGAVVQLVRIRACHARGRGFESRPHRNKH